MSIHTSHRVAKALPLVAVPMGVNPPAILPISRTLPAKTATI